MTRKRADDLLTDVYGWLSADTDILDALGASGGFGRTFGDSFGTVSFDGDGEIVTYGQVGDPDSMASPLVAFTVIPGASSRDNRREEKTMTVEVEVSASNAWVESNSTLTLTRLLADVGDVLTTHRDGWSAEGQSGGTGEITPDEGRPRYSGVRRFDFGRNDLAAAHD